jgi:hypothetical protein
MARRPSRSMAVLTDHQQIGRIGHTTTLQPLTSAANSAVRAVCHREALGDRDTLGVSHDGFATPVVAKSLGGDSTSLPQARPFTAAYSSIFTARSGRLGASHDDRLPVVARAWATIVGNRSPGSLAPSIAH